jgi:branched-chain amino acid transport system substrate-binding protein
MFNLIKALMIITTLLASAPLAVQAEILIGLPGAGVAGQAYAWPGEQLQRGAEMAVQDINDRGGVLGQSVGLTVGDDNADPEQAVALAKKLVSDGAVFVAGHTTSDASIAAAPIYEQARIIMISPSASNPRLTDEGWSHVFRVFGRDDWQGAVAASYLADRWGNRRIAILHDGSVYGKGLADEVKKHLNDLGVVEMMYLAYEPRKVDYWDVIDKIKTAAIDVVYLGGRSTETGLIVRGAGEHDYRPQFVSGDAAGTEEFWLITGAAGEGTLFTSGPDPRKHPAATPIVKRFRESGYEPEGYTLYAYAAVQTWAQAVEKAGTLDYKAVIDSLQAHEFDTVLGRISFDDKGDVRGFDPFVWYIWKDGNYAAVDPAELTE